MNDQLSPKRPLATPVKWMIAAAAALFVTPIIWVVGLPIDVALVWAFIWFDVILFASFMLFRRHKS